MPKLIIMDLKNYYSWISLNEFQLIMIEHSIAGYCLCSSWGEYKLTRRMNERLLINLKRTILYFYINESHTYNTRNHKFKRNICCFFKYCSFYINWFFFMHFSQNKNGWWHLNEFIYFYPINLLCIVNVHRGTWNNDTLLGF